MMMQIMISKQQHTLCCIRRPLPHQHYRTSRRHHPFLLLSSLLMLAKYWLYFLMLCCCLYLSTLHTFLILRKQPWVVFLFLQNNHNAASDANCQCDKSRARDHATYIIILGALQVRCKTTRPRCHTPAGLCPFSIQHERCWQRAQHPGPNRGRRDLQLASPRTTTTEGIPGMREKGEGPECAAAYRNARWAVLRLLNAGFFPAAGGCVCRWGMCVCQLQRTYMLALEAGWVLLAARGRCSQDSSPGSTHSCQYMMLFTRRTRFLWHVLLAL